MKIVTKIFLALLVVSPAYAQDIFKAEKPSTPIIAYIALACLAAMLVYEGYEFFKRIRGRAKQLRYGDLMQPLYLANLELPDAMRCDPDVIEYIRLLDKTMRAEKVSDPDTWTSEQNEAYARDDWQAFSRLRGYTETEIHDFQTCLDQCRSLIAKYGEDDVAWIGYTLQDTTGILGLNPKTMPTVLAVRDFMPHTWLSTGVAIAGLITALFYILIIQSH